MKPLVAFSCCLAIGVMSASAKERMVKCRLLSVARAGGATELFLDLGKDVRPFRMVPSASIDAAAVEIPVRDDGTLRFLSGTGKDAKTFDPVSVPDGAGSLFVFMLPDADGGRLAAADAGPKELEKGGVYLFNGGSAEARLTVGEQTLEIGVAEGGVIGDPGPKDSYNLVATKVEVNDGTRWRSLKDGASPYVGTVSYWMIIFEDPKAKRPQLRIFKRR